MIPFDKIPDAYIEKAKEYSESFAMAKVYKEQLKQVLAVIMSEHIKSGESAAKAEALSKTDDRYIKKLQETQDILIKAEIGRAGLKSLEMSFEWYRSNNSLNKAKINLL